MEDEAIPFPQTTKIFSFDYSSVKDLKRFFQIRFNLAT